LQVFNKWGRLIFETTDFSVGWDGTYRNGNKAPAGVYVYQISYSNGELNIDNTKKGTVTLVR
ncbi:MAG: gliding motility-associated C-terminal domain-containing protein, partial [Bacteroidales bacterium]|nr:gliding motility-associated C-terminal domain-containing protein [Bacteroidales bacterium]